jgi:hypothetical protein
MTSTATRHHFCISQLSGKNLISAAVLTLIIAIMLIAIPARDFMFFGRREKIKSRRLIYYSLF